MEDRRGELHIGVNAFIVIWQQMKGWHILAKIVNMPLVISLARCLYTAFANYRFSRLEHCRVLVDSSFC